MEPPQFVRLTHCQVPLPISEIYSVPKIKVLIDSFDLRPCAQMLYDIGLALVTDQYFPNTQTIVEVAANSIKKKPSPKAKKKAKAKKDSDTDSDSDSSFSETDSCSETDSDESDSTVDLDEMLPPPVLNYTKALQSMGLLASKMSVFNELHDVWMGVMTNCVQRLSWDRYDLHKCETCPFTASSRTTVLVHMDRGHISYRMRNVVCAYPHKPRVRTNRPSRFVQHMFRVHNLRVNCNSLRYPPVEAEGMYIPPGMPDDIRYPRISPLRPLAGDFTFLFYRDDLTLPRLTGKLAQRVVCRKGNTSTEPGQSVVVKSCEGKSVVVQSGQSKSLIVHSSQKKSVYIKSPQVQPVVVSQSSQSKPVIVRSAQTNPMIVKSSQGNAMIIRSAQGKPVLVRSPQVNPVVAGSPQTNIVFKSPVTTSVVVKPSQATTPTSVVVKPSQATTPTSVVVTAPQVSPAVANGCANVVRPPGNRKTVIIRSSNPVVSPDNGEPPAKRQCQTLYSFLQKNGDCERPMLRIPTLSPSTITGPVQYLRHRPTPMLMAPPLRPPPLRPSPLTPLPPPCTSPAVPVPVVRPQTVFRSAVPLQNRVVSKNRHLPLFRKTNIKYVAPEQQKQQQEQAQQARPDFVKVVNLDDDDSDVELEENMEIMKNPREQPPPGCPTCMHCGRFFWSVAARSAHKCTPFNSFPIPMKPKEPVCPITCPICNCIYDRNEIYTHLSTQHPAHFSDWFSEGRCFLCKNPPSQPLNLPSHWEAAHNMKLISTGGQNIFIAVNRSASEDQDPSPTDIDGPTCVIELPSPEKKTTNQRRFKCPKPFCRKTFSDPSEQMRHLIYDHSKQQRKCLLCPNFSADSALSWNAHMQELHPSLAAEASSEDQHTQAEHTDQQSASKNLKQSKAFRNLKLTKQVSLSKKQKQSQQVSPSKKPKQSQQVSPSKRQKQPQQVSPSETLKQPTPQSLSKKRKRASPGSPSKEKKRLMASPPGQDGSDRPKRRSARLSNKREQMRLEMSDLESFEAEGEADLETLETDADDVVLISGSSSPEVVVLSD